MVNGVFTLFANLSPHRCEGTEAAFDLCDFIPQLASRGEPRHEVCPAKTAEIRGFAPVCEICSLELPLDHSLGDNATW